MVSSKNTKRISQIKNFSYGLCFLIILWIILSYLKLVDNLLLPYPHEVIKHLYTGFVINRFFFKPIIETLSMVLLSFFIGSSTGIILGILAGYYENIYAMLEFPIDFFRSLPSLLLIPLSIIFFGIGLISSLTVISFSIFIYVFINSAYGIRYNKTSYQNIGKLYKIDKLKEFKYILLPSILPNIFAGIKIGLSISFIVTIGSEMLSGHRGLGGRIVDAYMVFNTKEVFSIIIIVGLLSYLGNKILNIIEKKVIHWRGY